MIGRRSAVGAGQSDRPDRLVTLVDGTGSWLIPVDVSAAVLVVVEGCLNGLVSFSPGNGV